MSEQNDATKQTAEPCGPGCSCGASGAGSQAKWVICGAVALAAVVVIAARMSRTPAADTQTKETYAAATPTVAPTVEPVVTPVVTPPVATVGLAKTETTVDAKAWGSPLRSLSELNKVATDTDAIFVVLPSGDGERMAAVQKEVLTAASTITAQGTRMGTFLLSRDSAEYTKFVDQIGAPAVLAMCKGRGMAAVPDKQVSQQSLLKAFVSASRPSGCGPSGCGPASAGCN